MKSLNVILLSQFLVTHRTRIIDPSLFKAKYVVYVIATPSKGYLVERRYSDFLALRQEVIKDFPGYLISPMPVKKIAGNIDPLFIQERKAELQLFLNDLMHHPILKGYELLEQFLSLGSKEWEEKAKLLGKSTFQKELEDYITIEGEAKVLFTNSTKEFGYKIMASTKDIKDCFTELKSINKVLVTDLDKIGMTLSRANTIYQRLSMVFQHLDRSDYSELFLRVSNGYSKLGEAYKIMRDEVQTNISEFYSFYSNEVSSLDELIMAKKTASEHMEASERKLVKKKEKNFEMKNTATWELDPSVLPQADSLLTDRALAFKEMLPRESQEVRKLRMIYGYFTNKVIEEFLRILKKNENVFKDKFESIGKIFAEREQKIQNIWLEIADSIHQLRGSEESQPATLMPTSNLEDNT